MKKYHVALLCCAFIFALSACGKKDDKKTEVQNNISTETEQTSTETTTVQASDDTATTEKDTTEENEVQAAPITAPTISFSGNADDIIKIEKHSYYEADNFIMYFEAGSEIPGDAPETIAMVMKELEELYRISFSETSLLETEPWLNEYFGNTFNGLNQDNKKVNILVFHEVDDGAVQWSDKNSLMIFDTDLFPVNGSIDTIYHEMGHALRLRQGPNLGQTFEEGIGVYAQDVLARKKNYPAWDQIQYVDIDYYEPRYDTSKILEDPEEEFRRVTLAPRDADQANYHYGFRFITFLEDTYGPDVIKKICETSRKYDLSDENVDLIIQIIKESTDEDVFKKFAEWVPEGWDKWCRDYLEYMDQFVVE